MDILINYPEFEGDIKECFSKIIVKYDFKFSRVYEGCYTLNNGKCLLKFTYDRGEVACNIKQPGDATETAGYNVLSVYRFLYPDDTTYNKKDWGTPHEQLSEYADALSGKLKNILMGDFSWEGKYASRQNQLSKMIKFVRNNLDRTDPIYQKFYNDDVGWINDLKSYLEENNISL